MNLLAKKKIGWLFAIGVVFIGCKDEQLGLELPPEAQLTELNYIEINLPSTNVFFDSLRTDGQNEIYVGEYENDIFGGVNTSGYVDFSFKTGFIPNDSTWIGGDTLVITDVVYDTAFINLDIRGVISDNQVSSQTISVSEVTEEIYSLLYLSNADVSTGDQVGEGDVSIQGLFDLDLTVDTAVVSVGVFEDYGSEFFDEFVEETTGVNPFGLKLESTSSNGIYAINLVADTTELIVQMTGKIYDKDLDTGVKTPVGDTTLFANFRLSTSNHFTHVDRDRSGSSLDGITNKGTMDVAGNNVFYNPLAGIHPMIDLTPFKEFAESEENILIQEVRMTVEFEPEQSGQPVVSNTRYYFGQGDGVIGVNWPGSIAESMLLTDNSYAGLAFSAQTHVYDTLPNATANQVGFFGRHPIFYQTIYNNVYHDMVNTPEEDRSAYEQAISHVSNLVMAGADPMVLSNSAIKKDGIKLEIFYAKLK